MNGNTAARARRAGGATLPASSVSQGPTNRALPVRQQQSSSSPLQPQTSTDFNLAQMTPQQALLFMASKIASLEKKVNELTMNTGLSSPSQSSLSVVNGSSEEEMNEMKERFNGLVEIQEGMDSKVQFLQESIMFLQKYTMEVNKELFDQVVKSKYTDYNTETTNDLDMNSEVFPYLEEK